MSYLHTPHLFLAGKFYTDPSTVNNDPRHYDPERFGNKPSPWQEPEGKHHFKFKDVVVTGAKNDVGNIPDDDPLLDAHISTKTSTAAKIVDLDVYQQAVSTIYGLKVFLMFDEDEIAFEADLEPMSLNHVWFSRVLPKRGWDHGYGQGSYGGDAVASGYFLGQLVLTEDKWPADSRSATLNALREKALWKDGKLHLSIRLVMDGYFNDPAQTGDFRTGRLNGVIGPLDALEPIQAPGPRWLNARPVNKQSDDWFVPALNGAPFLVDAKARKLRIDLANGLAMDEARGAPCDLGTLTAYCGRGDQTLELGTLDYDRYQYDNFAAITELMLSAEQIALLAESPLTIVSDKEDIKGPGLWQEAGDGIWTAVDNRVHRLARDNALPDVLKIRDDAVLRVFNWQFGSPMANRQIESKVVSVTSSTPGVTPCPYPNQTTGNTASADGALTSTDGTTDENGMAKIHVKLIRDPGKRAPWLDSQLYFIECQLDSARNQNAPIGQGQAASVLAWADYEVCTEPNFSDDIRPLMEPYAALYPGMGKLLDLTDETSMEIYKKNPPWNRLDADSEPKVVEFGDGQKVCCGTISFMLTRDINDPRLMPVTRDMCPNKIVTMLHYYRQITGDKKGGPCACGSAAEGEA